MVVVLLLSWAHGHTYLVKLGYLDGHEDPRRDDDARDDGPTPARRGVDVAVADRRHGHHHEVQRVAERDGLQARVRQPRAGRSIIATGKD